MNVAQLGLECDASGALRAIEGFEKAAAKAGKTGEDTAKSVSSIGTAATTTAAQLRGAELATSTYAKGFDRMAQVIREQQRVQQQLAQQEQIAAAQRAASAGSFVVEASAAEASRAALVRKDAALLADVAASGQGASAARILAASWAAEAGAADVATAAITRHTAAARLTGIASLGASANTGLFARGIAALGGPVGAVVVGVTALQSAFELYKSSVADSEKETEKQRRAFERLSDTAKIASVGMRLVNAERTRAAAAETIRTFPQTGNVAGVLQANRDIERVTPIIAQATKQLNALNREADRTKNILTNALATDLVNVTGELDAFARGGKIGADAFRIASDEWNKSAFAIVSLGAALRDLDPNAIKLLRNATELARKQAELSDKLKVTSKVTRDVIGEAQIQLERQRALNGALGEGVDVIADLNAKFDLKAKLAQIDARYTGEQARELRTLAIALDAAMQVERDYAKVQRDRQTHIDIQENKARNARIEADAARDVQAALDRLQEAREKGARTIADDLEGQRQQIALLKATGEAARKLGEEYLYAAKFKQYLAATRADGGIGDPIAADKAAREFVDNQRLLNALTNSTKEWGNALSRVFDTVRDIAGIFGGIGSDLTKGIQLAAAFGDSLVRAHNAQKKAIEAAGTKDHAQAVDAANAASLASGLTFFTGAVTAVGLFASSTRKAAEEAHAAAKALQELRLSARNTLANFTLQANGSPLEQTLAGIDAQFKAVITELVKAGGTPPASFGPRKAVDLRPTATDFEDALAAYNRMVERAKEAAVFQERQTALDLNARFAAATGQTAASEAIRQQIADERELFEARAAGATETQLNRIAEVQLAEARKREADRIEADRRRVFDLTNQTLAFTDPRRASQNAFEEGQLRAFNDAVARGASAAEQMALQLFQLAEAADRALQIARQDRNDTFSLTARLQSAAGDTAGAEATRQLLANATEIEDAIARGMSATNVEILRLVQIAEQSERDMLRAIAEQTKAINAAAKQQTDALEAQISAIEKASAAQQKQFQSQIDATQKAAAAAAKAFDEQIATMRATLKAQTDAIDAQIQTQRNALDLERSQLQVMEQQVQTAQKVVDALDGFLNQSKLGPLSTLSPEAKLAEARRQFDVQATAARAGDANAATALPGAANALLEASRAFNASNAGFVADFNKVQDVLGAVRQQFGATLPTDVQALEQAKRTVAGIERTIEVLGKQKDTLQQNAEREISAIQALKDRTAEAYSDQLDLLRQLKDAAKDAADEQIAKLRDQITAINTARDAQIAAVTAAEQAAHQDRLLQLGVMDRIAMLQANALAVAQAAYNATLPTTGVYGQGTAAGGTPYSGGSSWASGAANTRALPNPMEGGQREMVTETKALRAEVRSALAEMRDELRTLVRVGGATGGAIEDLGSTVKRGMQDVSSELRMGRQHASIPKGGR